MGTRKTSRTLTNVFLGISLAALFLLVLVVYSIPVTGPVFPYEKQMVAIAFAMICLLGITAGITPTSCTRLLNILKEPKEKAAKTSLIDSNESGIEVAGHHPTCESYTSHVFQIGQRMYCTGCTGLVIGAFLAIGGTILYFFFELVVPNGFVFFWVGFIGVTGGLIQHSLYNVVKSGLKIIRVLVNVFFVVGAFLLLVGVVETTNSFLVEIYLLLSILYWIFTRIMMSKHEHWKVCTRCGVGRCPLSKA